MKYYKIFFFFILFIPSISFGTDYYLYYLGGQSNMDGLGFNKDLPGSLNKSFEDVLIFQGNSFMDDSLVDGRGTWTHLQPGNGLFFKSDGVNNKLSSRFGPEMGFSERMLQLRPGQKIAIIKYSKSGSSIDSAAGKQYGCWEPDYLGINGINQYDHFLATVKNAMAIKDIDGDGTEDHLIPSGIVWMQGESDAHFTREIAERYLLNLQKLMGFIRATFNNPDMPIAIGLISDSGIAKEKKAWEFGEIVQKAQRDFVGGDVFSVLISSTLEYPYLDKYHYTSESYIDLGRKFAEGIYEITNK